MSTTANIEWIKRDSNGAILNGQNCLVSLLGHLSGQWIKSVIPINPSKNDIQALGAAITYCRRYALAALVGVCPEDDDGESTMERNRKKHSPDQEEVKMNLPDHINVNAVERYLIQSANQSKTSVESIKKRANENMDAFLKAFHTWESKIKEGNKIPNPYSEENKIKAKDSLNENN